MNDIPEYADSYWDPLFTIAVPEKRKIYLYIQHFM